MVSYQREIDALVFNSILQSIAALSGWLLTVRTCTGFHNLAQARNAMLAECYVAEFDRMVFVDADITWAPAQLVRLLSHDVDVVAGVYPQRVDGGHFPCQFKPGQLIYKVDPHTGLPEKSERGLIEVDGVPAGFLSISWAAIHRMTMYFPDRWYHEPAVTGHKAWDFFRFAVDDHCLRSEDLEFCRLWTMTGGKVWADPGITLQHHGRKIFTGSLGQWLLSQYGDDVSTPEGAAKAEQVALEMEAAT